MENKKSKKISSLSLAIFILSAGFLFLQSKPITYAALTDADLAPATATLPDPFTDQDLTLTPGTSINPSTDTSTIEVTPMHTTDMSTLGQPGQTVAQSGIKLEDYSATNPDFCPHKSLTSPSTYISCAFLIILRFAGWILSLGVLLFSVVIDANQLSAVLQSPVIYQSWAEVRDFLNIGFILVLLYIAFCTIFQVSNYSYKNKLLWLVIMALLVNFSYPITRFIIDASNVLMYTLLDNFFRTEVNNTSQILTNMPGFSALNDIIIPKGSIDPPITQLLASIIFVFLLALTILSMSTLFLIRTVALAILIIFSPVAFIGSILGKGGQWWDYLFKYAFFGPVMVFMLAISIRIMEATNKASFVTDMASGNTQIASESLITSMARFAIPIVVLWIGMGVAQKMGIEGASMALANAQGMAKWTGGLLKKSSLSGLKAIDRNTLSKWHVSPRQFLKAWKQSTEEAESDKLSAGTGVWHDRINKVFSLGKHKTNYADLERQKLVSKKSKELKEISEEAPYLLDKLSGSMGSNSPEAVAEMKAIFRIIYGNNDQDELMDYIRGNIVKKTDVGKRFKDMGFDEKNSTVSGENVSNAVIKLMGHSKVKPDEINKELLDLGNIAATKGGIGYGAVEYNQETKQFERITGIKGKEGKQAWAVASKIMTTGEAQNIPKTMHRNHFTDQDESLNEEGKALLRKYASPTAIKHIERHKPDFYKSICLETDVHGETTADKMLSYASNLQKGTADGWDPTQQKHSTTLRNPEQALSAAAWTVALQTRAGVPKATIKNKLENLFSKDDVAKILNLSTNQDVDAKPDDKKKEK